jgi:hypothetical protein
MTISPPAPMDRQAASRSPIPLGGMPTPAPDALALAAQHFGIATLFLVAGGIGLVWVAPELAWGTYPSPHVAGITHLFTLGWLTTTIFGALSQLLTVALGAPLRSRRVGSVSLWTFAPGVALFAGGVAASSNALRHAGIALIAIGLTLAIGNVGATLPRARTRDVTWGGIALALGFLTTTLVLGVVLVHNLHTGFLADARIRVLATHLHVAIIGWALTMMIGVSHRLLPMFFLAHGADTRWTKRSLALLAPGLVALGIGLNVGLAPVIWLGVLLLEAGVGCFLWQARAFYRSRVRKRIDTGMRFAVTALTCLAAGALLGPVVLALGTSHRRLATVYVLTGFLGGILLYVVGFLYKIVPLLAWTVRFRSRIGREPVPTAAELYSARIASIQLTLMGLGLAGLVAGVGAALPALSRSGAGFFLAGILLFAGQLWHIAFGRRR